MWVSLNPLSQNFVSTIVMHKKDFLTEMTQCHLTDILMTKDWWLGSCSSSGRKAVNTGACIALVSPWTLLHPADWINSLVLLTITTMGLVLLSSCHLTARSSLTELTVQSSAVLPLRYFCGRQFAWLTDCRVLQLQMEVLASPHHFPLACHWGQQHVINEGFGRRRCPSDRRYPLGQETVKQKLASAFSFLFAAMTFTQGWGFTLQSWIHRFFQLQQRCISFLFSV